jgi:hypothetical protein
VGIFLVGALGGICFALFVIGFYPSKFTILAESIFIVVAAILGGIIIQFFEKPVIIVSTSFAGSYSIVYGIDTFTKTGFSKTVSIVFKDPRTFLTVVENKTGLIACYCTLVVLFILGCVLQFRWNVKFEHSLGKKKESS